MVCNYTLALRTSVRPHLSVLGSCRLQDDPRERRGALSSYRIRYAVGNSPAAVDRTCPLAMPAGPHHAVQRLAAGPQVQHAGQRRREDGAL